MCNWTSGNDKMGQIRRSPTIRDAGYTAACHRTAPCANPLGQPRYAVLPFGIFKACRLTTNRSALQRTAALVLESSACHIGGMSALQEMRAFLETISTFSGLSPMI